MSERAQRGEGGRYLDLYRFWDRIRAEIEDDVLCRFLLVRGVVEIVERVQQLHFRIQQTRHFLARDKMQTHFPLLHPTTQRFDGGRFGQRRKACAATGLPESESGRIQSRRLFEWTTSLPLARPLPLCRRRLLPVRTRCHFRLIPTPQRRVPPIFDTSPRLHRTTLQLSFPPSPSQNRLSILVYRHSTALRSRILHSRELPRVSELVARSVQLTRLSQLLQFRLRKRSSQSAIPSSTLLRSTRSTRSAGRQSARGDCSIWGYGSVG